MSNSSLEQDLKTYQDLIAILQEHPTPTEAEILNILIARDRIQTKLTETYLIPDNILNTLQELDNILRKKQATIAQQSPNYVPILIPILKIGGGYLKSLKLILLGINTIY